MTTATTMIHLEGASAYHCDQMGDSATIRLGNGHRCTLTANQEDFLRLASTCREAARRIALKNFSKLSDQLDKEFEETFKEEETKCNDT